MDSQKNLELQNDNSPDLDGRGRPTDAQTAREFGWIFWQVLSDFGVPRQLVKFHYKIWELCKPGKVYYINDSRIAESLGLGVSRTYVCNLRRKLRDWNNGEYDSGVRHFSYISVIDNYYNPGTKEQIPTGYEFSKEFQDLLIRIVTETRENRHYQTDWLRAARQTIARVLRSYKNYEFGYYRERKEKRPRSLDNVLGTLLLNVKRTVRQATEFMVGCGFEDSEIRELLLKGVVEKELDNALANVVITRGQFFFPDDFAGRVGIDNNAFAKPPIDRPVFWRKVSEYVADREAARFADPGAVSPGNGQNGVTNYDGSIERQFIAEKQSDRTSVRADQLGYKRAMDGFPTIQPSEKVPIGSAMDSARKRFLQKDKMRE